MLLKNTRIGITTDDVRSCTDKVQLQLWMADVESDINDLTTKLETAVARQKKSGEYADPIWFTKVKTAKRTQGMLKNAIQTRLSILNKESRPFAEYIIDALKLRVSQEEFNSIVDDARILERRSKN